MIDRAAGVDAAAGRDVGGGELAVCAPHPAAIHPTAAMLAKAAVHLRLITVTYP